MPTFRYRGVSTDGRSSAGTIEAESPRGARARLRERGVYASKLESAPSDGSALAQVFSRRVGAQELARTIRQLATLLHAGVPLAEAVESLRKQRPGTAMSQALESVRSHLMEGQSLAQALARHPRVFPAIYTGMVEAGEASGALEAVLRRIADHADSQARLQAKVRAALTYPAIMTIVGGGVVLFLLAYVVPQVSRVFAEAQQTLPLPTRVLLALGSLVSSYGLLLMLTLAAAGLGLRYALATEQGRRRFETLVLATPWLGKLAANIAAARFAQTLSTMVSGGLPLIEALRISRSAAGSLLMEEALARAEAAVAEGEPLAEQLSDGSLFDPMIVDMIGVGERSGDLEGMLARASEAVAEEVKERIDAMAGLLEPVMILIMAGLVLFVVLAIMLPVFEMNQLVR